MSVYIFLSLFLSGRLHNNFFAMYLLYYLVVLTCVILTYVVQRPSQGGVLVTPLPT